MTHDLYGRPPRPPPPGRQGVTRRGLFRLRLTDAARLDVDYDSLARRNLAARERGSNEDLLRAIEPVAAVIAEIAGQTPATRMLDVGAGDGNLALACAGRGAVIEACDPSPEMVEQGSRRTGNRVSWRVADAQRLPHGDGEFDAVVSAFGVPSAPDPHRAVRELMRVAAPGARVVVAAWVPRGLPGGLWPFIEAIEPLPDGVPSPAEWGREPAVRERLSPYLDEIEVRTRTVALRFADPDRAFEAVAGSAPLTDEGLIRLRDPFDRLLSASNAAVGGVEVPARYLVATGRRTG